MRLILTICACLSFVLLMGCGRSEDTKRYEQSRLIQLQAGASVKVGVKVDSPPFGYKLGGNHVGFDVDIITAVCDKLRLPNIEFVPVTSANRIEKLEAGEIDLLIASMTITRSRDERIDFSIPYFQDGQGILVPFASSIQNYTDLDGKRIGATTGSTSLGNLKAVAPDARVLEFANFKELSAALVKGEVDAITTDTTILVGLAKSMPGGLKKFRIAGRPFSTEPYGIGMIEGESDLRDAVNTALMELWEEGQYQLIYGGWFGMGTAYDGLVSFGITPVPK